MILQENWKFYKFLLYLICLLEYYINNKMNLFGLSFVLFIWKSPAGKGFFDCSKWKKYTQKIPERDKMVILGPFSSQFCAQKTFHQNVICKSIHYPLFFLENWMGLVINILWDEEMSLFGLDLMKRGNAPHFCLPVFVNFHPKIGKI